MKELVESHRGTISLKSMLDIRDILRNKLNSYAYDITKTDDIAGEITEKYNAAKQTEKGKTEANFMSKFSQVIKINVTILFYRFFYCIYL